MKRTPKGPKYRNARQGVRPAARLAATEWGLGLRRTT